MRNIATIYQEAIAAGLAQVKKDSSTGYATGVTDMTLKSRTNSVLLVGDSMLERSFATATATVPAANNDGTATLTMSQNPITNTTIQVALGDIIRVNNSPIPELNQLAASVTAVDGTAKTITYTTTGPHSQLVGGNNPFIVIQKMMSPLAFFPILNTLVGGELEVISNCTQGGARLEQIETIFDALAVPAKFGIFLGGRNNFGANSPPDTYAQVIVKAKSLLDKMLKKCVYLVIVGTPPQTYSDIGSYPQRATIQQQFETWLAQYARSVGAIYVNAATAASGSAQYRDAASSVGAPTSGWSPDGTHQSGISSFAMAKAVAAQILPLVKPTIVWPSGVANSYANDPSFVFDNTMLTGVAGSPTNGTGTVTGTAPDSIAVTVASGTASVALSQVARTIAADGDTAGNWMRAVITNTTGVSSITIKQALTTARVTNGDVMRALARIRVSSLASPGSGAPIGMIGLDTYFRTVTATDAGVNETHAMLGDVVLAQAYTEGFSGAMVSPWLAIRDASHGAVASGFFQITIDFNGAGGATIDIAHPHARKRVVA